MSAGKIKSVLKSSNFLSITLPTETNDDNNYDTSIMIKLIKQLIKLIMCVNISLHA